MGGYFVNERKDPPIDEQVMDINRQREIRMQAVTRAKMAEAKVPAPMNHENYGYRKPR